MERGKIRWTALSTSVKSPNDQFYVVSCSTYADDLLVRRPGDEQMVFVLIRVELDAVRDFAIREPRNTLS